MYLISCWFTYLLSYWLFPGHIRYLFIHSFS